ncbi:MAG: hypothetical protein A2355_03405 [Spirochaetes bacterium RIFOXYB1_FULL_32_8]|nr:MAG: hypothetical protein A2355_03405 [Spirochaetes bacterium RIFOXYB1_FULL_32_8]
MKKLNSADLLDELILIGGWCLYVYSECFEDSEEVPVKRTTDIDFLIPNPPKLKHKANVVELLKDLDFSVEHNFSNNFNKFVHPDLEVEFLMNLKGRGEKDIIDIKDLSVTAILLRYLSILESNVMCVSYNGLFLQVPEPAAYTLHKYIVSERRKNEIKAVKDMETAKDMTRFLLKHDDQRIKLKYIFNNFSNGWQKTLLKILEKEQLELFHFFKS